jgi:hypothetical protein
MSHGSAAPSASYRIPLYAKASKSSRTLLNILAVLTCLWILGGWLFSGAAVYLGGWLVCLALLAAIGFPTALRSGAWLEGGTLVVRSTLTSRRFDLAASPARLDPDAKTGLPLLTVHDTATDQQVSVLLREQKKKLLLSPQTLHALARAIMAGGYQDPAREQVAGQLGWLAENWPGSRSPQLR